MDILSIGRPLRAPEDRDIGLLGVFASPAVENTFRKQHFRDDRWLCEFLVAAGILRVSLLLSADYHQFGAGSVFGLLLAGRLLFVLVSVWVLFALRRATSPAASDRLFVMWGFLIVAMTVCALSARAPSNSGLLLMSFAMIVVTYCVTHLPLFQQAAIALTYSTAVLLVCRQCESRTLAAIAGAHAMSHFFGLIMSWRLNRRRREIFLARMRETELRTSLEAAAAEVRTLRGLLCICAWCKRIRDEAETWKSVEEYVQNRTHASFSHGICPDCLRAKAPGLAGAAAEVE